MICNDTPSIRLQQAHYMAHPWLVLPVVFHGIRLKVELERV